MTLLTGAGVTARTARAVAERLVLHRVAYVAAPRVADVEGFRAAFAARNIAVHAIRPREIDVKALRESLGCSQSEFARLLGFTLDSVQNWEQPGRPKPQGATLTLLTMAARDFDATVRLIAESQTAA
jgi:DNA-binding transcriptional regulator YiaG